MYIRDHDAPKRSHTRCPLCRLPSRNRRHNCVRRNRHRRLHCARRNRHRRNHRVRRNRHRHRHCRHHCVRRNRHLHRRHYCIGRNLSRHRRHHCVRQAKKYLDRHQSSLPDHSRYHNPPHLPLCRCHRRIRHNYLDPCSPHIRSRSPPLHRPPHNPDLRQSHSRFSIHHQIQMPERIKSCLPLPVNARHFHPIIVKQKQRNDKDINVSILYFHKSRNTPLLPPKNLRRHCFRLLLGHVHVPGEIANNEYAKFWGG